MTSVPWACRNTACCTGYASRRCCTCTAGNPRRPRRTALCHLLHWKAPPCISHAAHVHCTAQLVCNQARLLNAPQRESPDRTSGRVVSGNDGVEPGMFQPGTSQRRSPCAKTRCTTTTSIGSGEGFAYTNSSYSVPVEPYGEFGVVVAYSPARARPGTSETYIVCCTS
jgi:hypothetical protein